MNNLICQLQSCFNLFWNFNIDIFKKTLYYIVYFILIYLQTLYQIKVKMENQHDFLTDSKQNQIQDQSETTGPTQLMPGISVVIREEENIPIQVSKQLRLENNQKLTKSALAMPTEDERVVKEEPLRTSNLTPLIGQQQKGSDQYEYLDRNGPEDEVRRETNGVPEGSGNCGSKEDYSEITYEDVVSPDEQLDQDSLNEGDFSGEASPLPIGGLVGFTELQNELLFSSPLSERVTLTAVQSPAGGSNLAEGLAGSRGDGGNHSPGTTGKAGSTPSGTQVVRSPAGSSKRKTFSVGQQLRQQYTKAVLVGDGLTKTQAERDRIRLMKELDPSLREFAFPDFGFRDDLNHAGHMGSIWQLLYDHVSQFPKYERLRNYIKRAQAEKMELLKKQFERGEQDEDPTKKGSAAGWADGLVAAEATPGTTNATPINFERFESLMNSVLKPAGAEGAEAPEVDSEQKKYDQYILEKLFMATVEKNKSPEEIEVMRQEKFANPITGQKGARISSKAMREVWVAFKQLTKAADSSFTEFKRKQRDFRVDRVNDSIEELKIVLDCAEPVMESSPEQGSAKRLERESSRKKLAKLLVQKGRLEKQAGVPKLVNQSPQKQAFKAVKSGLDNQLNKRYLVRKNKELHNVPNFVKLNANRNVHSVNISQDVVEHLTSRNTSLVSVSLVTRPKISARLALSRGSQSPDYFSPRKGGMNSTLPGSFPPSSGAKLGLKQVYDQNQGNPLATMGSQDYVSQYSSRNMLTPGQPSPVKSRHLLFTQTEDNDYRSFGKGENVDLTCVHNSYSDYSPRKARANEVRLLYDNKAVSPRLLSQSQLKSASRHADPPLGEIRLSAYEAYKLKKLSTLRRYSPNKLLNRKVRDQERQEISRKRFVNNYLQDAQQYAQNKQITKNSPQEDPNTLRELELLNDQNSQIQNCIKFGLNQLRQRGMREKPQDLALLKLLEEQNYSLIDKGMLYNMIVNKCTFSKDQISYNKQLIFKFFHTIDSYQSTQRTNRNIQNTFRSSYNQGGTGEVVRQMATSPDLHTARTFDSTEQESVEQTTEQELQLKKFKHFFLNRKTHSALDACTEATNRLAKYYKQQQAHVQILDHSVFDKQPDQFQISGMHDTDKNTFSVVNGQKMQVVSGRPQKQRYENNGQVNDITHELQSMAQKKQFPQLINIHTNGEPLFASGIPRGLQRSLFDTSGATHNQKIAFSQRKVQNPKIIQSTHQNYPTSREFSQKEANNIKYRILENKRQENQQIQETFEKYEQQLINLNRENQTISIGTKRRTSMDNQSKFGSVSIISNQQEESLIPAVNVEKSMHNPSQSSQIEVAHEQVNLFNTVRHQPVGSRLLSEPNATGLHDDPYLYQGDSSNIYLNIKAAIGNVKGMGHKTPVQMPIISQQASSSLQEFVNTNCSSPANQHAQGVVSEPTSIFAKDTITSQNYGIQSSNGATGSQGVSSANQVRHVMRGVVSTSINTTRVHGKQKGYKMLKERRPLRVTNAQQLFGQSGTSRVKDEFLSAGELRGSGVAFNQSAQSGTNNDRYLLKSTDYNCEGVNFHAATLNQFHQSNQSHETMGTVGGPILGPSTSAISGGNEPGTLRTTNLTQSPRAFDRRDRQSGRKSTDRMCVAQVTQPTISPKKSRRGQQEALTQIITENRNPKRQVSNVESYMKANYQLARKNQGKSTLPQMTVHEKLQHKR